MNWLFLLLRDLKMAKKNDGERTETLMRLVVLVVSGIILGIWKTLIQLFVIVNFIMTLFTGKRNAELSRLSEIWSTQIYYFLRYMTFSSNKRPFPFSKLAKSMNKFEK
jgi:hypothetical protein